MSEFDPNELDNILQDAEVLIPDNLNEISKYIPVVADESGEVELTEVYKKLDKLIDAGEKLINKFEYQDIEADGVLSGMSSVMTLVRNTANDFIKLHTKELEFKQKIALEQLKIKARQQQQERKHEMDLALVEAKRNGGVIPTDDAIDVVPYTQESAVDKFRKMKAEVEKQGKLNE